MMRAIITIGCLCLCWIGGACNTDQRKQTAGRSETESHNETTIMPLSMEGSSSMEGEYITIIDGGEALATIILPSNPSTQLKESATILQTYIQKSTGVLVPINEKSEGKISIHIGSTRYVNEISKNTSRLDEDGFVLWSPDDNNYVILGGSDWGTEFGVYEFLERFLGVRWLMPTTVGIEIPKHKTLRIPKIEVHQNPVYLSREVYPIRIEGSNALGKWGRFNRLRDRIEFHHNLKNLFPVSEFGKKNPNFYPMIGGKRHLPSSTKDHDWQPNFAAPGLADAAAKRIIQYFKSNPSASSYSLGINDSRKFDEILLSKSNHPGKTKLGLINISDEYYNWVNEVAEKVLSVYPDKAFGTLAYTNVAEPPKEIKLNPNIVPFLTSERMRWGNPSYRQEGHELTKAWAEAASTLGWYDYAYGDAYLVPRVWFHTMGDYLKWGAQNKVEYYYAEANPNWGEGPKMWVLAKLLWNPNQDVDSLLNDWYYNVGGAKAAPKLREFYSMWERFWTQDCYKYKWSKTNWHYLMTYKKPVYLKDIPDSYLIKGDQLMKEALALAETSRHKERVTELLKMWNFYKTCIRSYKSKSSRGILSKEMNDAVKTLKGDKIHAPSVRFIERRFDLQKDILKK